MIALIGDHPLITALLLLTAFALGWQACEIRLEKKKGRWR
jgi:hypothetical protein